jgi:hypothetical protein
MKRELLRGQAERVAGAVDAFVMVQADIEGDG